ncbi:MAG: 50S ribosomal protein L18, partial [Antricoccus sp.]
MASSKIARTGGKDVASTRRNSKARRHFRLRKKISGTATRPRLVVTRSTRHITAQIVDDTVGRTLVFASSTEGELRGGEGDKSAMSKRVGQLVAERAKSAGIEAVV